MAVAIVHLGNAVEETRTEGFRGGVAGAFFHAVVNERTNAPPHRRQNLFFCCSKHESFAVPTPRFALVASA